MYIDSCFANQFGFKSVHGTDKCVFALKKLFSYYVQHETTVTIYALYYIIFIIPYLYTNDLGLQLGYFSLPGMNMTYIIVMGRA